MKEQKVSFIKRVKNFLKRNSYALVVVGSAVVLTVALLVTATMSAKIAKKENSVVPSGDEQVIPSTNTNIQNTPVQDEEVNNVPVSTTTPIVFTYPVQEFTLGNTYSEERLVKNETLNEWTTHLGVDFIVADGSDVVASFAGTIESITYDNLTGTTIVIDHGDGLKSSYSSLSSEVNVVEGQSVQAGEVIGKASVSLSEQKLGAHVHFEVMENGSLINPMTYLGEK